MRDSSDDPDFRQLCSRMTEYYGYPVDSVLISPDLEVCGHINVHERGARDPQHYLAFLEEGLAKSQAGGPIQSPPLPSQSGSPAVVAQASDEAPARTRPLPNPVTRITPENPTGTILDVVRRGGFGEVAMKFFMIDTSLFPEGGVLEMSVRMGSSPASGSFELCAPVPGEPHALTAIDFVKKVEPGATATLEYVFEKGGLLGLAAKAAVGSAEGETNAFLVKLSVRARDSVDGVPDSER